MPNYLIVPALQWALLFIDEEAENQASKVSSKEQGTMPSVLMLVNDRRCLRIADAPSKFIHFVLLDPITAMPCPRKDVRLRPCCWPSIKYKVCGVKLDKWSSSMLEEDRISISLNYLPFFVNFKQTAAIFSANAKTFCFCSS